MQSQQNQGAQSMDLGAILENLNSAEDARRQQAEQLWEAAEQQPQTVSVVSP